MRGLPFWFERAYAQRKLVAEDLVDQRAGFGESRVDDLPQNLAVLSRALHEALALQHGKVLRDVGTAHVQQLGELTGRARPAAEVMYELMPRGIGEGREDGGVHGVALSVIVHATIIAEFRNFATWQLSR